jgi:RNA polymerase sigma-70 factor (ECF subfamily)
MSSNTVEGSVGENVPTADPLTAIVAGCRRREPEAERELVLQTKDRVYRTVVRLVGIQDADDVTQQVFVQAFRRLDRFSGESAFSTWLYRVTVNEALQHLRQRRSRRTDSLSMEPADHRPDFNRQIEERELLDCALAQIEAELRVMFVLREVDGLSYEEIAKTLDVPMGTVASRLSRARQELQEKLRRLGWSP